MKTAPGRLLAKLPLCGLLWAAFAIPVHAQMVKVQQSFTGATAPGWTLGGSAVLTAAGATPIDPVGSGWLRLTPALDDDWAWPSTAHSRSAAARPSWSSSITSPGAVRVVKVPTA